MLDRAVNDWELRERERLRFLCTRFPLLADKKAAQFRLDDDAEKFFREVGKRKQPARRDEAAAAALTTTL